MRNPPYTVALTGGIGSGKSTIAGYFAASGVDIIDADVIAREVVEPGTPALQAIIERYGDAILTEQGTLQRSRLREIIFATPDEKNWLNALLHPLINARTQQLKAQAASPYVLWVVPLLVENRLQRQADRVLVVDTDEETQLRRTLQRDNVSLEQAKRILAAQATRQQRLDCADDIIDNSGAPEKALPQVAKLHQLYLKLAATRQD
ncbi:MULTISPECIES: dephospho-CoA kinase [Pantoea]|uniref:dephospho-CoA kinase n=1 Tax=Pantoea TaxID=53335 RepID=UPI0002322F7A|nr:MULTISPECIES: dephospho-CoA kinase [Pantoea]AER33959.1 dephospho-CoA kinase CoaE [Pantoea ananatis PA13]ASN16450.1 dephospho-CoA kinase [Pantoea ananatis]MCS3404713.1 dephospho-CoA kinase [Pantoea sp. B566]MDC7865404.1 dephospho-CoA kinase [Pantoea ananatis]MDC7869979.1 dephospho-CoA kinase [Pantoea ananatis]